MSEHAPHPKKDRVCGACSLCCTVLRVDELSKPADTDCEYQRAEGGCAIHANRPPICRGYRCLWLQGGLGDDDRPDRLGAVVDLQTIGAETRLAIQEAQPGGLEASPGLRAIIEEYATSMPVRLVEAGNLLDADRPYRVWLPGGEMHRVEGEWRTITRAGAAPERRRLPFIERIARRIAVAVRRIRLSRFGPRS